MKKKKLLGAVLAAAITTAAISPAFAGCSLVSSNSRADMRQVIAEVNISRSDEDKISAEDKQLFTEYKEAVGTTSIYKSDLIASYLNYGYSSSGDNSQIFSSLVNGLVENAVLTQYAVMYVLNAKGGESVLAEYNAKATYTDKLEYLLHDETAEDPDLDVKVAKYNLFSTLNATLDSLERSLLNEDEDDSGSGTRATPGGVNEEDEDYYPQKDGSLDLDYNVYTGYAGYQLAESGKYQDDKVEGTTKASRNRAYNSFLSTLANYGLVNLSTDNVLDPVHGVQYINEEYAAQLESRVIAKYYDLYEQSREEQLNANDYEVLKESYNNLRDGQERQYALASGFESAMDGMSDTSFILYSPDTEGEGVYGYVYNILLPFSSAQSAILTGYKAQYVDKDGNNTLGYFNARNSLIQKVKTTDQREPWFTGETDYSFKASNEGLSAAQYDGAGKYYGTGRDWLFFKNNLTKTDRYDPLDKYIGKYAYNGRVYELENGKYDFEPKELTIDDMLSEFKNYVNFVLGEDKTTYETKSNFFEPITESEFYSNADKKEINYDNFIYATGKVDLGELTQAQYRANLFDKDTPQYKALAAVNELQYAYTTDTAVLSEYVGYNVTLGDTTGFIKEFERACHEAIERGAGSFNVCAGDYGWHLIYVTYTFGEPENGSSAGGDQFVPEWTEERINKEGTFENLFYESVKSSAISNLSTTRRSEIINRFNNDVAVTTYASRYSDLLDI